MNCLIDYIGLKTCDVDTSPSGLFINQLPGVELKLLDKISDEEQADYLGVWNDVQTRASIRFKNDIRALFSKRYRLKQVKKSINIGKQIDLTDLTNASAEYRGLTIELSQESDQYTFSNLQVIYVQYINFYADSVQDYEINIFDLDLNTILDTFTGTSVVGWNQVSVLSSYNAQRIFIGLDATLFNTPNLNIATINQSPFLTNGWGWCLFNSFCNVNGKVTAVTAPLATPYTPYTATPTQNDTNTNGVSAIFSVQCEFDNIICNNLNIFGSAFLYLLGSELMDERLYTSRLNEYTLFNRDKAKELKKLFECRYNGGVIDDIEYFGELTKSIDGIDLSDSDCCIECNTQVKFAEAKL